MSNKIKSGIYVLKLFGVPKYVGQGMDVYKRMNQNHKNCPILESAFNKYGIDAFEKEIIVYCDLKKMDELEIFYIKKLNTHCSNGGYNVSWGGRATGLGREVSEESKLKMSFAHKGKKFSKETKLKMSLASKGRSCLEETKLKISDANKGSKNGMFGKTHSKEIIKKISQASRKRWKKIK